MHRELIDEALAALRPHRAGDRLFGNVASVLVTEAVCESRLSSVPPSPWKTVTIS